jgi:AcrR family transcriptional regulator
MPSNEQNTVLVVDDNTSRRRWREYSGQSSPEIAIFKATERLLAAEALHEISVAKILREAAVSRAAFYHYFSSKYEVVASLVGAALQEIHTSLGLWAGGPTDTSADVLRQALRGGIELWVQRGPILAATIEHLVGELRALWMQFLDTFTDVVAQQIERERSANAAPPGPPADAVAGALVWSSERLLYLGLRGIDHSIPTVHAAGEALLELWSAAIYGPDRDPGMVAP